MKKLAIGCGVAIVLCMIGLAAAGYYVYYKASQAMASLKQFAEVADLDKNVANHASFARPSNGELTDDQVRRFVSVVDTMHARMGKNLDDLQAKADQIERLQKQEHRDANLSEVYSMMTELIGLVMQAKKAQVDALNAQHFSLQEYSWVRSQVYAAAGLAASQVNLSDLQDMIKKNGGTVDPDLQKMAAEVPERNKTLVQPYLPKLKDGVPFAFFGL